MKNGDILITIIKFNYIFLKRLTLRCAQYLLRNRMKHIIDTYIFVYKNVCFFKISINYYNL